MKLNIIPIHKDLNEDPLTWDIKLDTGYNQQQIFNELSNLDWENSQKCVMPNRFEMRTMPSTPGLKDIEDFVRSPEFKTQILDTLYDSQIYWYWSIDRADMEKITHAGGLFVKDMPGFTCPRHVDTRSLVATGMLMFNEEDIPGQRTFFYRDKYTQEKYWESNSSFERGWLNATVHNTWHEGYNTSDVDRYAYLFHLSLKLF